MNKLKLGRTSTTLHRDGNGDFVCVYHTTEVVRFNDSQIKVDTGGYFTSTTARRVNEVSGLHNLGIGMFYRHRKAYLCLHTGGEFNPDQCYPFGDSKSLTVDRITDQVRDSNGAIVDAVTVK